MLPFLKNLFITVNYFLTSILTVRARARVQPLIPSHATTALALRVPTHELALRRAGKKVGVSLKERVSAVVLR